MKSAEPTPARRVFLSYAQDDHAVAQRIRGALIQADVAATEHILQIRSDDLAAQLRETVRTSDVVVALLSPAAESRWVGTEIDIALSGELDRRGIEFFPVLVAPTDLSPSLRDRPVVDFTVDEAAGLRNLIGQIEATSRADFSVMSPREFEDLVADLLRAVGFRLDEMRHRTDPRVDLRATYQQKDPFGRLETQVWLVEAKLYSHERVSVDAIMQLAGALAVTPGATNALLVTNAQLTSVARDYVVKLDRSAQRRLQVLDGIELKRLIREFPSVAARHFGGTTNSDAGPVGDS